MITSLIRKFDNWFLDGINIGYIDDYFYMILGLEAFEGGFGQWVRCSRKDYDYEAARLARLIK